MRACENASGLRTEYREASRTPLLARPWGGIIRARMCLHMICSSAGLRFERTAHFIKPKSHLCYFTQMHSTYRLAVGAALSADATKSWTSRSRGVVLMVWVAPISCVQGGGDANFGDWHHGESEKKKSVALSRRRL
jgi:hypothetical protein